MPGATAAAFPNACSARAAFALGRMAYRCLVCGRVHLSGSEESHKCRQALSVKPGWEEPAGPFPPELRFTPAFLFTKQVWEARRYVPLSSILLLPEWVLALDPFSPDLGQAFEELAREERGRQKRRLAEAWESHREFCTWFGGLRSERPPARVASIQWDGVHVDRMGYWVRPAIELRDWSSTTFKVSAKELWDTAWTWTSERPLDWSASKTIEHVSYSRHEFAAVFEAPIGCRTAYFACRGQYGGEPGAGLVWNAEGPDDALGRVGNLERFGQVPVEPFKKACLSAGPKSRPPE